MNTQPGEQGEEKAKRFVPSENDKDVCANCGDMFFHCRCGDVPPSPETLYTYYQIDLENCPVDWNTTICESLDDVRGILQFLDTYFDDDINAKATISGIAMTRAAFQQWQEENLEH